MFMNKAEDTMYCGMVLSSAHSAQALDSSSSLDIGLIFFGLLIWLRAINVDALVV